MVENLIVIALVALAGGLLFQMIRRARRREVGGGCCGKCDLGAKSADHH